MCFFTASSKKLWWVCWRFALACRVRQLWGEWQGQKHRVCQPKGKAASGMQQKTAWLQQWPELCSTLAGPIHQDPSAQLKTEVQERPIKWLLGWAILDTHFLVSHSFPPSTLWLLTYGVTNAIPTITWHPRDVARTEYASKVLRLVPSLAPRRVSRNESRPQLINAS